MEVKKAAKSLTCFTRMRCEGMRDNSTFMLLVWTQSALSNQILTAENLAREDLVRAAEIQKTNGFLKDSAKV